MTLWWPDCNVGKSSDGWFNSQWRRKRFWSAARREASTLFYEQARLQTSAIIVEPAVKEQRRNSSKFQDLKSVTKMNQKGGGKTCNINYLKSCKRGHRWPKLKKIEADYNMFSLFLFFIVFVNSLQFFKDSLCWS